MDQNKIQAILDWQLPQSLKQLRGFLGLTGYYRQFIKGYAVIGSSLTNLLKKDNFHLDSAATDAFHNLK